MCNQIFLPFRKLNYDVSGNSEAAELCGDYYCPELRTGYRMIFKDKRLILWDNSARLYFGEG